MGAILIVMGLYAVLWGKHKERIESKVVDDIPLPVKDAQIVGNAGSVSDGTDHFTEANGQNGEANNKLSSLVISMPHMKASQEGKA